MAFQPVPGAIQANLFYLCNGVEGQITMYASHALAEEQETIQEYAELMDDWMAEAFMPLMPTAASYLRTETRGLGEENTYVGTASAGAEAGSIAGSPLPANVSACFRRSSSLTGRSARGRIYIPFCAQASLAADENYFTSTFMNGVLTSLNNIQTVLTTGAFTEVVVSRYNSGVKRAEGVMFPISQWDYSTLRVASRRDRLPDIG